MALELFIQMRTCLSSGKTYKTKNNTIPHEDLEYYFDGVFEHLEPDSF